MATRATLVLIAFLFAYQMAGLIEGLRCQDLRHDDDFIAMAGHWPVVGSAIRWIHATVPAATEHAWSESGAHTALGTAAAASTSVVLEAGSRLVEFGLALFSCFSCFGMALAFPAGSRLGGAQRPRLG